MAGSSAIQSDTGNDMVNWSGRMRPFLSYRSRYATLSSIKERCGSSNSLASFSGSTHNLLDPVKLMSMQDDARCHKISAEVMKRCLYKPDAPCRRRAYSRAYSSSRSCTDGSVPPRMFQSLPVTPMQSLTVTPSHSPTNVGPYYYSFLSRGTTPRVMTPEPEEEAEDEDVECDAGLASVLRPQPRYICAIAPKPEDAATNTTDDVTPNGSNLAGGFGAVPRSAYRFRRLNMTTSDNAL